MAVTKKFADKSKVKATIVNHKNNDIYQVQVQDSAGKYIFGKGDGFISGIPKDKAGNTKLGNGVKIDFTVIGDRYFSYQTNGTTKQITKAEADKLESLNAAVVIDSAANTAIETEKIKAANIKRKGLIIVGSIALISAVAGIFYAMSKARKTA